MPLKNRRKIRKILGALEPSLKPDLLVAQLKEDTTENLNELIKRVSVKFAELRDSLLSEFDARLKTLPNSSKEINSLRSEFETKLKELEKEDIGTIQTQMQDLVSDKITDNTLRQDLEDRIQEVENEFRRRLGNLGGGNANRQINVNSSVMSARYTDINFQQFGNIGWSVTNDDDLKRVNIRASILSGGGGGTNIAADTFTTVAGTQSVLLSNVPSTVIVLDVNGQVLSTLADDYSLTGSVLSLLNVNMPASVFGKISYTF